MQPRWLSLIAAVSLVSFVGLALVIASGPLDVDLSVASALAPLHAGPTGIVIDLMNDLGQALVWDPLVGLLGAALWLRGRRVEAVLLVGGLLLGEAGGTAAKLLVNRTRPPGVVVVDLVTQASFPSGHVTRTVVTLGVLVAFLAWPGRTSGPRAAVVALAVAFCVLMGIARIAVGEHWFTDVLGAALFGVFVLAIVGLVAPLVRSVVWAVPWARPREPR